MKEPRLLRSKLLYLSLILAWSSSWGWAQTYPTVENPQQTPKPVPTNKAPTKPKVKVNRQPVVRPDPPPVLIPESAKSEDQKGYEVETQKKFDELAARIKTLETNIESMEKNERRKARKKLRTAQGNRSVVRTKIKQLKYISPNDWFTLKNGIETAFQNLADSVVAAEQAIPSTAEAAEEAAPAPTSP